MASRWRTWDAHFATDILENKFSFDAMDSLPVGTRGKFRFNIPFNLLTIPIIIEKSEMKVGGRGRRLQEQTETKKSYLSDSVVKSKNEKADDYYHQLRKESQQKEWPSLMSKPKTEKHNKGPSKLSKKPVVKKTNNKNSNSQFEDAENAEFTTFRKNKVHHFEHIIRKQNANCIVEDIASRNETVNSEPTIIQDEVYEVKDVATDSNTINKTCDNEDKDSNTINETWDHEDIDKENIDEEDKDSNTLNETCDDQDINKVDKDLNTTEIDSAPQILCDEIDDADTPVLNGVCDESFTTDCFLKHLESPEHFILIQNLSLAANDDEFQELICSFGEISSYQTQPCSDGVHKNVLVRMLDSDHCVWVVSCLDGDIYEDDGERISAKAVDDILEEM